MRWLLRMLLFWAITGPLFYLFGLPYLLDILSKKTQQQAYDQCKAQLVKEGLTGVPTALVKPAQAENYCHCVSDPLILTKADVFDLVKKKPPTALNALAQSKAETCNKQLQAEIDGVSAVPKPNIAAPTEDGIIHL